MCDVQCTGVKPSILIAVVVVVGLLVVLLMRTLVVGVVGVAVQMRPDVQGFSVKSPFATSSNLLVDKVGRPGYIEGRPDADCRAVQVSGANLGHMAATVHLLVFLPVLVVVVGLECQLGAAHGTLETPAVEEGEVLERTHAVHLVHGVVTPQASTLVKVHSIHGQFVWFTHSHKFVR